MEDIMDCIKYAKEKANLRKSVNEKLMLSGVIIEDPNTTYIDPEVSIKSGTTILPNTRITGDTKIGSGCVIGPNTIITNCKIGDDNEILASVLTDAIVESKAHIGPFAYIRPKSVISNNAKIGDFVEIKNSIIGEGTKVSHLTYIGDCDVGKKVNFGCGCVVVNYDGTNKHRSKVGDGAFIGCNTNLVSPVEIGEYAYTAAGSTITNNVPEGSLAIARAKQEVKEGWVERKGYIKK